jgi:ferric-dicitrate binding protein FerR (iron transport regulator)
MPSPDPLPGPSSSSRRRFGRSIRLLALFALAVAAIAVALVSTVDSRWHIHMMIATGVGMFLTVLLGGGLTLLALMSNASGHDAAVHHFDPENDE